MKIIILEINTVEKETDPSLVMIGLELIANVKEIGYIFLRNRRLKKRHIAKIESETGSVACWEADFYLSAQDDLQLFEEYLEQVIQFGFATLFATAFPLAPFIAFCNACLELKLDAFKERYIYSTLGFLQCAD